MQIKPLSQISPEELYASFNEAFKDYARAWTKTEFENMLRRRGYVPELSFGAFDNDKLVSFTLNCFGTFNNKATVYDTGTGTIEKYRGQGLATKIFEASHPALIKAGGQQYLLEVLTTNTKAISVYTKLGFKVNRTLNYFVKEVSEIKNVSQNELPGYQFKEIELESAIMLEMHDFEPSWQNNFDALLRNITVFKIIGAFKENKLIGYGVIEPTTGDISQLAVAKEYRRKGIGSKLFAELSNHNKANVIKILNTDSTFINITDFLANKNILISGSQFEMIKALN